MSTEDQLLQANNDDTLKPYSFITCTGESDNIQGIQLILTSNRQPENLTLSPIGSMTGQCEELVVAGRLTYIRASYDDEVGLNGIEYFQGDVRTEYGDLNRRTDDW